MNIHKLKQNPKKLLKLEKHQLEHCLQLADAEVTNYERATKNYDEHKRKTFSEPYLKSWNLFRAQILDALTDLSKNKV